MARVFVPDEHLDDAKTWVFREYTPAISAAKAMYGRAVYQETRLPHRIVEAARIRTAQINGCKTCKTFRAKRDLTTKMLSDHDLSRSFVGRGDPEPDEAFYSAVEDWRTSTDFSARERLAIEFAEKMGLDPHSFETDEDFWERMHAHFEDAEIVDLTVSVACWIGAGRTLHALGIDPEVCAVAPEPV